jgi:hypothetical protein
MPPPRPKLLNIKEGNGAVGFSFSFAIRGKRYENCPESVNDNGYGTAILAVIPDPLRSLAGSDIKGVSK